MTRARFCAFAVLFVFACALSAEDVRVTVFTLKAGTEVEALRFSSMEADGQVTFSVTKTDGGRAMILGDDVEKRTEKMVSVDTLPPEGQKLIAAGHATEAARAERRKQDEAADQERKQVAPGQASAKASLDDKSKKNALDECESIRARCAQLWDQWQAALAKQRKAEDQRTQAATRYDAARAELSGVAGTQPPTPRIANLRAEMQAAAADVAAAEKLVKAATEDARVLQEALDAEKQKLAAAQKKTDDLKAQAPAGTARP